MSRFRIDSISELARQMEFTPREGRIAQLTAAEDLLHSIEPGKVYPPDFVVYRITGYRPRQAGAELLAGLALQHDLGLLIEQVSRSLQLRTDELREPVLSIDDVCERFNITSKTVQRWRRRGLPARRFIFPDDKLRVGFLLHSVERFFTVHRDQVSRATNFSQVDEPERQEIFRRARRLARQCGCCHHEISRRIARKLNRSPLTILHLIRKHDQEHPREAIFTEAASPISEEQRKQILLGYHRGSSLRELARQIHRPRSAVYRVILAEWAVRLSHRKTKFIDDPLYHQPDAESVIREIVAQEELAESPGDEDRRVPRGLPAYLQELYRVPLLTRARERALFLQYNFYRYQVAVQRRKLDPQLARWRDLARLEAMLARATEIRNSILRANLRLVVSVARRHLRPGLSLMELISDGNVTLMRAAESFDIHRGYRFSTYATLSLMKGFARSVPAGLAHRLPSAEPLGMERFEARSNPDPVGNRDQVRQLLSRLGERERMVLSACYGLGDRSAPATYEQVGRQLGLSKRLVRQIQQTAIEKLRSATTAQ